MNKRRILAIDYGTKKIGLAISDETNKIALPFLNLEGQSQENFIKEIKEICQKEKIKEIILGLPKTLEGKEAKQAKKVKKFAQFLKKALDLPIIFEDERFTSKMAQKFLERDKKKDDKVAAQILLQGYLDKENKR